MFSFSIDELEYGGLLLEVESKYCYLTFCLRALPEEILEYIDSMPTDKFFDIGLCANKQVTLIDDSEDFERLVICINPNYTDCLRISLYEEDIAALKETLQQTL